ncbi:DMT family transporter [uncultured Desulfosarcina sp.]|uniref:DMT family transporter n=1 Tax=uncultured Desulfosarcina sp. TaxID=218289 RepID=UPI0029C6D6FF|nr:DMT family transporter [uncultured Desulfosarcina sp.]
MINPETVAVTCGLCSAVAWGAGDFAGGFASRRGNALTVVLFSQMLGGMLMLGLTSVFAGHAPDTRQVLSGMLAGGFGVLGLVCLYKGLAAGRMGLVAPLSALVTAIIPMGFSFVVEGLPTTLQRFGLAAAMAAVWLLSSPGGELRMHKGELRLSLLAGLGFGLFFILMDHASGQAVLWPLLASKAGAVTVMFLILTATRQLTAPPKGQILFIALAGILDTAGTAAFTVAANLGRLDVSTVLASLYPASTIMLAWLVFRERLNRRQWCGVAIAIAALVLIAI